MTLNDQSYSNAFDSSAERLMQVSPRDLQGYVHSHGWRRVDKVGHLMVYAWPDALDQVLVPTDTTRPDYAERVLDVVEKLSAFESRHAEPVLVDLLNYAADILRFRVISPRAERGTLPLSQAIDLLDGARRSLLSAAHSALQPRRYHPKLSRGEAVTLLDACQMGQTEHGSFVVTIACPLNAVDADQSGLPHDDRRPFARRATSLLERALTELNGAIEDDRINSIVDQPEPIVSANLCEAILKMRPTDERGALEFMASWASSEPVTDDRLRKPVTFGFDEFESVEDVYRQLKPLEESTAKPWVAYVEELKGTEGPSGTREGEVVLTLFDADELVRARASLTVDQYQIAYDAHNPTVPLIVSGRLSRGPRVSRLSNITEIRRAVADDVPRK
jgi:hypothetical protein